ncbi:MAG: ABC transporter substrate-binding protein [Chloroflexi bacterium]|nr:ABC transporter substrate-binding protein [Chloroflexota bacterium]MBU1750947.1 ABC transporter substrate-binding protein [Chloroflexota bacterium]
MNRKGFSVVALLLVLGMVMSGLVACDLQPQPPESKELNVLMTPQEEWCQGMKQEFEAKYGITVNYVRMSSGESLARLRAEKDNPQFDIWWGGPIDSFVAAKQEGLLEAYNSPNYVNLLDQTKYKDVDNQWVGIYVGTLGFCTNTDWLAAHPGTAAPESWDDLLKPEFAKQILVAHPSTSGTSYTALATILQIRGQDAGWEYIKKYAAQMLQFTKSGAAPAKFVGQGEAAVGVVFSHDIVNEIDNNKLPLVLTFPKEGTGYEIGGMGIIKGGQHRDAAQKWFDWALTAEAQALGPKYKAYQAPTVKGVELSHPELLQVNLIDYNFQWAGEHKKEYVDKFTNEIVAADALKE